MPTRFRIAVLFTLVLSLAGCTQKIWFRQFYLAEETPGRDSGGYCVFDDMRIWPAVSVDPLSYEPITDSAFYVKFYVLPTDTSALGNAVFVETFTIDQVTIVEAVSGDTLMFADSCRVEVVKWATYNRKEFFFPDVVVGSKIESITCELRVSYDNTKGESVSQSLQLAMIRLDGWERVLHGRWQH